jgi:16S rRNA (cytosine1402-N4)-methyltransferase
MDDFDHKPVMVAETLAGLELRSGGRYIDGTVGGGGHAEAMLERSSPNGWLLGFDRDGVAIEAARARLARFAGRFELRQENFAETADWAEPGSFDGVLLDLGVSSPQLDVAERGFSFAQDGPLDMRMDRRQSLTAADLVNETEAAELARIFWEYADERESRRFARAIERERQLKRIETTGHLAGLIERLSPRRGRKTHPATKIFQALRIAVNDEIGSLQRGLQGALQVLKPGGRLVVITFHSLEDRVVKEFGRELARDYTFEGEVDVPELRRPRTPVLRLVERKAIQPHEAELRVNPRSRSAKLRLMEKI